MKVEEPKKPAAKDSDSHAVVHETLSAKHLWVIASVLFVALIAGMIAANHHHKQTTAPSAWATYTSQKYGFKFSYLKAWGTPAVAKSTAQTGFAYTINLSPRVSVNPKTKAIITPTRGVYAILQTADWTPTACPPAYDCPPQPVITKSYLEKHAKVTTVSAIYSSPTSFATLNKQNVGFTNLVLDDYQSLGTGFQNISAAHGVISQNIQGKNCPSNTLSSTAGCISQSDLDNLSQFLKSISAI